MGLQAEFMREIARTNELTIANRLQRSETSVQTCWLCAACAARYATNCQYL